MGNNVMVVAHANTLRGLVKFIDGRVIILSSYFVHMFRILNSSVNPLIFKSPLILY